MNKRPLTTIVTHLVRGALFLALLIAINMIRLAQGQPQEVARGPRPTPRTSRNGLGTTNGVEDRCRDHDKAERPQIASPQQNYRVIVPRAPSGTICGVESRAAHGQIAP